jgi:hypothetical protein
VFAESPCRFDMVTLEHVDTSAESTYPLTMLHLYVVYVKPSFDDTSAITM